MCGTQRTPWVNVYYCHEHSHGKDPSASASWILVCIHQSTHPSYSQFVCTCICLLHSLGGPFRSTPKQCKPQQMWNPLRLMCLAIWSSVGDVVLVVEPCRGKWVTGTSQVLRFLGLPHFWTNVLSDYQRNKQQDLPAGAMLSYSLSHLHLHCFCVEYLITAMGKVTKVTPHLQNPEKMNFFCFNHPTCTILLGRPQQTHTDGFYF